MRTDWPLGPALKQARIEAGISARAAARRAGISSGRWYQLETGVQKAGGQDINIRTTPSTVAAAARAVNWDVNKALKIAGFDPRDVVDAHDDPSPLTTVPTEELLEEIRRRTLVADQAQQGPRRPLMYRRAPGKDTGVGGDEYREQRDQLGGR